MKNLVLVGFMGSGKTVVGRRLAAQLGMEFCDCDQLIEQRTGRRISDIFAREGEAFFRQLERALVRELAAGSRRVIATGGGVVLNPENLRDLSATGIIICLWAEPEVLLQRLQHDTDRPLLAGTDREKKLRELLAQRAPLYRAIPLCVDTTRLTIEQTVQAVHELYRQHAGNGTDTR
ncbi:MAG: shikimate kinase [Verrucomicrobiae bacterium]|nr:shikimate kinase [Verrucomicrobiae bacterium]MDW8345180.1 shikimate kinase [Verrucomicrobiae bacterium]